MKTVAKSLPRRASRLKKSSVYRLFWTYAIIPTLCRALWSNGFRLDSVIPGILILCILHIFSPIRRFVIIWVSPPIAIHSSFPWIVSDGFFVLYYTPVSEKNQLPFFRRNGGSAFGGDFPPNQHKALAKYTRRGAGAAFAPMKKTSPGGASVRELHLL